MEKAKENLGDYKLKTASDYVVPEHQRVTTKSKRQQLVMLRAHVRSTITCTLFKYTLHSSSTLQITDTKKDYNKKLIALRDWKLQTVEKVHTS